MFIWISEGGIPGEHGPGEHSGSDCEAPAATEDLRSAAGHMGPPFELAFSCPDYVAEFYGLW